MNLELLLELNHALQHIQRVVDGHETGDAEALCQEIIEQAAAVAGIHSPEYGLALRARASLYRNRGDWTRAAGEYARSVAILEQAGDEALFQLIQAMTSLVELYSLLKNPGEAVRWARGAIDRIARYAREPSRYAPPMEPGGSMPESGGYPATELLRAVADALLNISVEQSIQAYDDFISRMTDEPSLLRLQILIERSSFAADHGKVDIARDTFTQAWELAHPSGERPGVPSPEQWMNLGQLALQFQCPEEALEAARHLRELSPTMNDAELLSYCYAALHIEASVWGSGDDTDGQERSLRNLLEFCLSGFGVDAEATINAENWLGRFLVDADRADEAYDYLLHVKNVRLDSSKPSDTGTAEALFDFALCLDKLGADTEAMWYYGTAHRIYHRVLGPDDPMTILSALNLAETARVAQDYETAERWFRTALDREFRSRGEGTGRAALALNNLAETLLAVGRFDEAAPIAERALGIRETLFGKESGEYHRSLCVVALAALKRGDEKRIDEVIGEMARHSGTVAMPFEISVELLEHRGDHEQAIAICGQIIDHLATADQGQKDIPFTRQSVMAEFKLGELHVHLGHWKEAKRHLQEALESELNLLVEESSHRSRRQLGMLLDASRIRITALLDVLSKDPAATPDDFGAVYQSIQQRKGLESRLLRLQKPSYIANPGLSVLTPDDPERLEKRRLAMDRIVESLRYARKEWVWALVHEAKQAEPGQERAVDRQDQVEFLERELSSNLTKDTISLELAFSSRIPAVEKGEAVVEYFMAQGAVPVYYAFVIGHEQPVSLLRLGDATAIHHALAQFRSEIIDIQPQPGDPDPGWRRRGRFLANRLLKPLFPFLSDAERLYVVPDSELFTLPFDLLPLDEGRLAIERWTITHLWSGGELHRANMFRGSPEKSTQAIVVSAPAFDNNAPPEDGVQPQRRFAPLPFAEREGQAVAEKIGAPHFKGPAATKQVVLACGGTEILHLATHSFNIPRSAATTSPSPVSGMDTLLFRARSVLMDPMERSGIALTGADRELESPTESSEGILFGSEVLDLDMRGTDLTVLSSCESGLGDQNLSDGIRGLRRAFRAAGAKTVVSSLWKVPDEATFEFMTAFYDRLLAEAPREQAFRDAKLALRQRYQDDPLFWAGFVMDGQSGPLFRFNPLYDLIQGEKTFFSQMSMIGTRYDSALEHIEHQRWQKAIDELDLVLASPYASGELLTSAAYRRAGVLRTTGRLTEALVAYDALIHDIHSTAQTQRYAVADRGLTKQLLGDYEGAYIDYTSVLNGAGLPKESRAALLVNRGFLLGLLGRTEQAIADCNEVLSDPVSPLEQRLKALLNRADIYRQAGRRGEAKADAATLATSPESAGSPERAKAHLILALCQMEEKRFADSIASVRRHLVERPFPPSPDTAKAINLALKLANQDTRNAASILQALIAKLN